MEASKINQRIRTSSLAVKACSRLWGEESLNLVRHKAASLAELSVGLFANSSVPLLQVGATATK